MSKIGTYTKKEVISDKRGISVGTSMVLTVFVLFCLITFATLSYVTAKADYEKSQQAISSKDAYYDACNRINDNISNLDFDNYAPGDIVSYVEKIDEKRNLSVEIRICGESSDNLFEVLKWTVEANSSELSTISENNNLNLLF